MPLKYFEDKKKHWENIQEKMLNKKNTNNMDHQI